MTPEPTLDPSHSALLLMDFQTGILEGTRDADALLHRAAAVRERAARAGMLVVYIRVAFSSAARAAVPDRNKSFAAIAGTDRLADGLPDAGIHALLRPGSADLVITKTRVGAFSTTDLARELSRRGIDTLVLAGIATSGVVLSTVRDGADRDYRLFVLADCCADRDPEVHRLLLERVLVRQADVIDSAGFDRMLDPDSQHA